MMFWGWVSLHSGEGNVGSGRDSDSKGDGKEKGEDEGY